MSFAALEALAKRLRSDRETGVPASRRWVGLERKRLDIEVYRSALAAHLGIDMSGVQHAGAEARSRDAACSMLDRIEEHVDEHGELPRRGAADEDEAKLARWIHNVTEGQNELDADNQERFDGL
eukprot:6508595-Pyramimonas_sp.AAC.1